MKPWCVLGLLVVLLALPCVSQAQWAVIDTSAIAQLLTQYKAQLMQYAEQMKQTQQNMAQIENQLRQIQYAYTTVQHGATNLQHLNLNRAQDLLRLGNELQRKLAEAEYIGYQAQHAWTQARTLYPNIQKVLKAEDKRWLERDWAKAQRDAARIGVMTQAMSEEQKRYQNYWADVINKAAAAQGNLQIQQAGVQAQGLLGGQLMSIEQQLATAARQQSQRDLQEASRTEMEQNAQEAVAKPLDTAYTPQGQALTLSTGKE